MRRLRSFGLNSCGSTAAEFALVLPVALLFLLGIIDVGRYAWSINQMEKAAQMGTRYAVATNVITPGLNSANFAGLTCSGAALTIGDTICREALGKISCTKPATSVTCSCANSTLGSASCPSLGTIDSTASGPFAKIAARIKRFAPQVKDSNITISYSGSGIGYLGDPATASTGGGALSDVSPVVTVQITGAVLRTLTLLGRRITLPSIGYSQTLEDGDGAVAY